MAIVFELVVNFGQDLDAARRASDIVAARPALPAGEHRIRLHPASLCTTAAHAELSVVPIVVGLGVSWGGAAERLALTAAEITELGQGLYGLLAEFDGYAAAAVGWDPEGRVDIDELRTDWAEELATGGLDGLVLADRLREELGAGPAFIPFAPGFSWEPWQGVRPSVLTADDAE